MKDILFCLYAGHMTKSWCGWIKTPWICWTVWYCNYKKHSIQFDSRKIVIIFYWTTRGSIFGAEKCLKKFRTTCWICFLSALLVQRNTSKMHQKCAFEQFKMHQKWNLTRDSSFFSPKSQFWCIFLSEINNHVSNYTFGAF